MEASAQQRPGTPPAGDRIGHQPLGGARIDNTTTNGTASGQGACCSTSTHSTGRWGWWIHSASRSTRTRCKNQLGQHRRTAPRGCPAASCFQPHLTAPLHCTPGRVRSSSRRCCASCLSIELLLPPSSCRIIDFFFHDVT